MLLTILLKINAKGIEFASDRSRAKIDTSVTTISMDERIVDQSRCASFCKRLVNYVVQTPLDLSMKVPSNF